MQADTGIGPLQGPLSNAGNYTGIFNPSDLNLPQGQFEIQKATIAGGLPSDSFSVFNDTYQLDGGTLNADGAATFYKASDGEWIVTGGTNTGYLFFYFGASQKTFFAPFIPPFQITLWLTFDPALQGNQALYNMAAARARNQ